MDKNKKVKCCENCHFSHEFIYTFGIDAGKKGLCCMFNCISKNEGPIEEVRPKDLCEGWLPKED